MRNVRKIVAKSATVVVAVLVVVGAMIWLSGTFRRDKIAPGKVPAPEPAALGPTTRPTMVSPPHIAEVAGSVQSEQRTSISARLVANIKEILVKAGDHVDAGKPLVILDDRDMKARLGQAHAVLKAAEAGRDLAKTEVDRLEPLIQQKAGSVSELDTWKAKYAEGLADAARAQQAVYEADVALSDTQITSPIKGIVVDRQAEPGDQASPGKALLSIYDPDHLRLDAWVPESYLGRLSVGQKVTVSIQAVGQQRTGTVHEIVPAADPTSRSFLVKVQLEDPAGLKPGMYGRLHVPLDPRQQVQIPLASVQRIGQLDLVQVVIDGRPQRRALRLGHVYGDNVEVLAGLDRNDQILLSPVTGN